MDEPLLTLSDAARRLEVPLEELTRAVVHRRIDFKLVDGIPQVNPCRGTVLSTGREVPRTR